MACFAGFLVGREVSKKMKPRGTGTIIFTGATASVRGGAGFSAFSGAKFALRSLAQSMARELGPEGIHVAHVIIDGKFINVIYSDHIIIHFKFCRQKVYFLHVLTMSNV
jgi:NAD(P)-dependent dehydrogenase (short-subunit alcohol dehydrogenase family)